jgi:hypothetical protein
MHRRTILSSVALVAGVSALAPAASADAVGQFEQQDLRVVQVRIPNGSDRG